MAITEAVVTANASLFIRKDLVYNSNLKHSTLYTKPLMPLSKQVNLFLILATTPFCPLHPSPTPKESSAHHPNPFLHSAYPLHPTPSYSLFANLTKNPQGAGVYTKIYARYPFLFRIALTLLVYYKLYYYSFY
ncbi:hypothetical protein COCSADRAFT_277857 [Bipolaris sorokiniana ND90Pr]|uniref:Uncharacterized protein n=1 Tax=Cochliobolus sativus (strain ND90Pr / ATCC 201652) TaxID=665912 RepID=M2TI49_COCSN|nr:uncharacterized protein COCSADRAFT_277857 [Bipolaris sorokiniana ND90Pr]EMD68896.1 hypothetical protein COCSADRAFT_277857 [Bipolaris sorokiniana ND90Pr]